MAYTTTSAISSLLQTTITSGSTPSSGTVDTWITWAKAEIDALSGQVWELTTSQVIFNVDCNSQEFRVSEGYRPLHEVTSAEYNSGTAYSPSWTAYASTDFYIKDEPVGILHFSSALPIQDKYLRLTMTYGPETTPDFITNLATQMVSLQYIKSGQSNTTIGGAETIRVGPISISQSTYGSTFVKDLIAQVDDGKAILGKMRSYLK